MDITQQQILLNNAYMTAMAAASHKHAKKQETGDDAKSCTTYQNLIFDETGSHTEPIIVCDVEEPPTCPKNELSLGMEVFFGVSLVIAFVFGCVISKVMRM